MSKNGGGVSRRAFLGGTLGGIAAGALVGFVGADSAQGSAPVAGGTDPTLQYPFYGQAHPVGIATPPQRHCLFMTFDLTTTDSSALQSLLARWSAAFDVLMAGHELGTADPDRPHAVPTDTGEATDLGPNGLTLTLGLGPGVFDDRFGLAARKPAKFDHLPALPSDQLQDALTGGDLSIQACADDPQVAFHAVRDLSRLARGVAVTRWTVMGFGRASAGKGQTTPRNLLGFKDGTRNIRSDADLDAFVWHDGQDQAWMKGGTYQVARKIHMHVENWDADRIEDQERVFGRDKRSGAPLTGTGEFDTPDFARTDGSGARVIDPQSHVALAAHENNGGLKILRRSYNFTDGMDETGQIDAGLLFLAYMKDPAQFVTLQTRLGSSDALNEYISHVGSGVFAVPPTPERGHFIGEALFA